MALTGIIAEIGQNHLGSMDKAKELIRAAKESGANYAKLQAITPEKPASGSMAESFYAKCSLTGDQYVELMEYGRDIGIPVFYSIFGKWPAFYYYQLASGPFKISGHQFLTWENEKLGEWDNPLGTTVVSIPRVDDGFLASRKEFMEDMNILYVAPYLEKPNWNTLIRFRNFFGVEREIGLSDHSVGIEECVTAIREYDCKLIEKHFSLGEDIVWEGKLFRDSVHSCNPKQMETLVKIYEDKYGR